MLVRTFGVFMEDGTYRDSHWPEEVLIRAFKYQNPKVDISTSDFSGTVFYQYRLAREALKSKNNFLGLVRVRDDDREFFGFFGSVPDPKNAYSATTTTMRSNCISCHAELFYGINTVFSLERDPLGESRADSNDIWRELATDEYELRTKEFVSLSKLLNRRSSINQALEFSGAERQ